MFKKPLSIILIMTLLLTSLVIAPITAQAQPMQTSQTAADAPTQLGADNSLGEMFSTAVNREQNDGANGITDVSVKGTKATVVLNNEEACTVIVGIYDESDDHLIATAIQRSIPANAESVTLNFSTALPQYYYLRAFILDSACCPLAKQYESSRYTQAYAEFLEKTTDDFPAARVMNLDNDTTDNFAVLDDSVTKITTSANTNIPVKTGDNTYTFSNIDDTLRSLKQGDIFTFELNDNPEVVKIGAITVSDNTATITSTKAEMEEVFDYVKIDATSEQPQTASTGDNPQSAAQTAPLGKGALAETGFDFEGEYSVEKEFKMNDNEDACRFGITGSVTVGATAALKLHVDFTANIQEISVTFTYGGKVNIGLELKLSVSIPLGSVPVPLAVAGIVASISASLELSAEAKVEVEFPYNGVLGFSYSNTAGFTNLSHKPEFDPQFTCEGKLFAGVKLTPSVSALMLAKAEISGTAGIQAVGTRMPTVTDVKSSDHLCRWCIEGSVDLVFEAEAELEFGLKILGFSQKLTFKLGDISKRLFDYHVSANNGFGKGECKNRKKPDNDAVTPPGLDNLPTGGSQSTSFSHTGPYNNMVVTINVSGSGTLDFIQMMEDYYTYKDKIELPYCKSAWEQTCAKYDIDIAEHPTYVDWWSMYGDADEHYTTGGTWYSGRYAGEEEWEAHWFYQSRLPFISKVILNVSGFRVVSLYGGISYEFSEEVEAHIFAPCEIYSGNVDTLTLPGTVKHIVGTVEATNMPSKLEINQGRWKNLTSVTIPATLKYSIFDSFPNVETAILFSEADSIFFGCSKLRKVTIGDNVTKLGAHVLRGCYNLKSVSIPSSVTEIGKSAFASSGLERIIIPGSVKRIGEHAFDNCRNLREVILEDGVQEIDRLAFENCPNLERIVIPASVGILDETAFINCTDVILDYDGTVEQWNNIVAKYSCDYTDNTVTITKMEDLPDNSRLYQNCTIYCYPNEDSETSPAPTGGNPQSAAQTAPLGKGAYALTGANSNTISGKYAGAEYLIAVEDAQNGLLNGDITALKQVTADDSGCIDISGINCPDGQYLNTYGACRHPSAHAQTVDGKTQCACDICGASVKPIITGESSAYIDIEDRLLGDADCDKNVTILDATAVQRKLAGFIPTRFHAGAADADSDGTVTILDATAIQRYLVGFDKDKYGISKIFNIPPTEDIAFYPNYADEGDPAWFAQVHSYEDDVFIAGVRDGSKIIFPGAADYTYITLIKMPTGSTEADLDHCLSKSNTLDIVKYYGIHHNIVITDSWIQIINYAKQEGLYDNEEYADYYKKSIEIEFSDSDPTADPTEPPTEPPTDPPTNPPTETPTDPPTLPEGARLIRGDVDLNGTVDENDLQPLQNCLVGDGAMNEDMRMCADVDGDGTIWVADLIALQKYLNGEGNPYGIGDYLDDEPPTEPVTTPPTDPPTVPPTDPQTEAPTEYVISEDDILFEPGSAATFNPVWYAWVWGATSSGKWIAGTDTGSGIVFPGAAEYDNIVVVKMVSGTTKPEWSNGVCRGQSVDIRITGNRLVFTGWSDETSWGSNKFTAAFQ